MMTPQPPAQPQAAPFRVLLVEDSVDDRATYRRLLGETFDLEEATSVREGLDIAARDEGFDCIIVDYQLPDGDSISFIEELRSLKKDSPMPALVVVTGHGSEATATMNMKAGALDYLPKNGINAASMARCIRQAVAMNKLKQESRAYQEKLEKANRGLSEFAHTAAHDIKAPLRHIISYCDLLREDFAEKLGPDGNKYTSRLIINARRLQQLVDDLLAYSESREAEEEKSPLDFNAAMREVLETQAESITETGATFTVGQLPTLPVYPVRIKRLLQNLISNAIKYRSAEPLQVDVSVTVKPKEYIFAIKDNGRGIAPEYRADIFVPFKRLHSRDEIEGSGLGLAICRDIAAAHGGHIWVESEPGKGSTFFFSIPKN